MFGLPRTDSSKGYSGSESYRYVDRLINGSTSTLCIVTPYLGSYYSRMLIAASRKKRIRIIVSKSGDSRQEEAIRMFMGGKRGVNLRFALYSIVGVVLFGYLNLYTIAAIAFLTLLFVILFGMSTRNLKNISVKVATGRFIHEKLYIAEEEAIVGSANLTYSGMHKNIEHIDVIKDKNKINELSNHFEQLWKAN